MNRTEEEWQDRERELLAANVALRFQLREAHAIGQGSCSALQVRVADWVRTRIGPEHMASRERAMRLLEEACELAQAEGVTWEMVVTQAAHVFNRPAGDPAQEAGGVAVCLLAWCEAAGYILRDLQLAEIERIEAKPLDEIRGSLARKNDVGLVTALVVD